VKNNIQVNDKVIGLGIVAQVAEIKENGCYRDFELKKIKKF
jgi:hypothetical protein